MQTRRALACLLAAGLAATSFASVGDFRVLPYQQNLTTQGLQFNWFTPVNVAGTLTITGGGLGAPIVLNSSPTLLPVLDYQVPAELGAGGAFPFATTAIFEGGVPARNFKHAVEVTGLQPDTEYTYTVTQGASSYSNTFRTAPLPSTDRPLRFHVVSDSETLVSGRTRFREWSRSTPNLPGSTGRPLGTGPGRDQYLTTETLGYRENIKQMELRDADVMIMPGDLIEGTGAEQQRRWDEFWRHNAGQYDDLLSARPLIAAIGNNCIFNGIGAGEGGNGGPNTNQLISYARQQWSAYFDWPSNGGDPAFQDLYYSTDYGPVTIITLCSVKATQEANSRVAPPVGQGLSVNFPANRDTNRAWFSTPYAPADIPDFNQATPQWDWTVQALADARNRGQIIFLQWHHTPFSRGVHGSSVTSPQSGEAMRIYAPLAEQYRVAGIFCGHSEVAEMSYFDLDNDGYGVHLWDVGFAGDGLRGVEDAPGFVNNNITNWRSNPLNPEGQAFTMNPFNRWTADQSEPELWNGNQLLRGGKHYGFLEVNVRPLAGGQFEVAFQNFHNFPLNAGDANFTVTGFELRTYNNRVLLRGPANDLRPVACDTIDFNNDGSLFDPQDIDAFLSVYSEGPCVPGIAVCNDIDFNNDGASFDPCDIDSFLSVFAEGDCSCTN
jgi:hypothetical protein